MNVVLIKWGIAFFNDKLKVLRLKRTSIIYYIDALPPNLNKLKV